MATRCCQEEDPPRDAHTSVRIGSQQFQLNSPEQGHCPPQKYRMDAGYPEEIVHVFPQMVHDPLQMCPRRYEYMFHHRDGHYHLQMFATSCRSVLGHQYSNRKVPVCYSACASDS
ncbi:hypothetical protein BsWGS_13878 [Bradybaena similaris]